MTRKHCGDRGHDLCEGQPSLPEGLHTHLIGGVVDRGRRSAHRRGPFRQCHRGKRLVVEGEELPGLRSGPVDRRRGVGHPVGPVQPQRDRNQHGRRAGLHEGRAVHELDHRVHHAGRVHHDVDPVDRYAEEQVRLDHLQPLVDQRRRVDGHHGAHVPGRVRQRLLDRDVVQLLDRPAAERPAARGQHQPAYLVGRAAAQALRQRAVLGVDRHDLAGLGAVDDQGAADDQALLVGQRERVAGVERGQGGPQPDRTGDRVEHHVARPAGSLAWTPPPPVRGTPARTRPPAARTARGCSRPRSARHPEPVGVGAHDVQRLGADRSGRPEHHDVTHHTGHPLAAHAG